MDFDLPFAERLLGRLRKDQKRLAPRRAAELNRVLGRRSRYFQRVQAKHFRLEEAFAVMRFLGFEPWEYLDRLLGRRAWTLRGVPGFFRRRCPQGTERSGLRDLEAFIRWGNALVFDDPAPSHRFALDPMLRLLDFQGDPRDVIDAAATLFSVFARRRPEVLGTDDGLALVDGLGRIAEALLEEGHLPAACRLLDLAFTLEQPLDRPALRLGLFRAGAQLSAALGFPADERWCLRRAALLAAHEGDFEAAFELAADDHPGDEPAEASPGDLLDCGRRDRDAVLDALASDRRTSKLGAAELDRRLGSVNAFTAARRGTRP